MADRHRRAVITLHRQSIEAMLALPPGAQVVAIHDAWPNPLGVEILIQADWLAEVPEDVNPPRLHTSVQRAPCGHLEIVDWKASDV